MTLQKTMYAMKARLIWILLCALWLGVLGNAMAQSVGTVTDLSGPLVARKADGVVKALSQKSTVDPGDILESEKNTYARIRFIDNSEITLKPNTQFKIEAFSYDDAKPEGDSSVFSLIKGGLRSITGLLGKRNKEKYKLNTPAATIGIRGTTFIAEYVPDGASGALNPGLYTEVLDGTINMTNSGGTLDVTAGQFGYAANWQIPPVILPDSPKIQFQLPILFAPTEGGGKGGGAGPGDLYCVVR